MPNRNKKDIHKDEGLTSLTQLRQFLYTAKVSDYVWFDGNLPQDPNAPFKLLRNPDKPNLFLLTMSNSKFSHLTDSQLQLMCERLQKPAWTETIDAEDNTTNLSVFYMQSIADYRKAKKNPPTQDSTFSTGIHDV